MSEGEYRNILLKGLFRCFQRPVIYLTFATKYLDMNKWLILAVISLGIALFASMKQSINANKKWEIAMANVKAYSKMLSEEEGKSTAYQLTIDQLKYYQDSILKKLNDTRKELGIKDKRLEAMQYVASSFVKADTIVYRDTIFREPSFAMDTLLGDEWYKIELGLKYPSTVTVKPEFKSEKHIVVSTKKETVNPPKKFFLFRWFQKKHLVLKVDVVEKNPYVDGETSRYVEIIR